ncbi:hypothetical protein KDA11_00100 [Candidatus Saccharibacteria bacterium]|nr:hypothetical protein [Candidatus Saccharibacteria bacterium]
MGKSLGISRVAVRRYNQKTAMDLYKEMQAARGKYRETLETKYLVELSQPETTADARHNHIAALVEKHKRMDRHANILKWIAWIIAIPLVLNTFVDLGEKYFNEKKAKLND